VQVWYPSIHFCGRRSNLRKVYRQTDGQTDRRTTDASRLHKLIPMEWAKNLLLGRVDRTNWLWVCKGNQFVLSTRPSKMIVAVFRFMMIHIALTHCYKLESFFTLIFAVFCCVRFAHHHWLYSQAIEKLLFKVKAPFGKVIASFR